MPTNSSGRDANSKFLRTRLGRVIRDIRRKITGNEALNERFATLLALAHRVRFQDHRQRGHKVYALHAPEVECIGKGKARAPYEFGCKSLPRRRCFVPEDWHDSARLVQAINLLMERLAP